MSRESRTIQKCHIGTIACYDAGSQSCNTSLKLELKSFRLKWLQKNLLEIRRRILKIGLFSILNLKKIYHYSLKMTQIFSKLSKKTFWLGASESEVVDVFNGIIFNDAAVCLIHFLKIFGCFSHQAIENFLFDEINRITSFKMHWKWVMI